MQPKGEERYSVFFEMHNSMLDESIDLHHYYKCFMAVHYWDDLLTNLIFQSLDFCYSQFSIAYGGLFSLITIEVYQNEMLQ